MIELDRDGYVSRGTHRLIFQHPHIDTQLIKVLKPGREHSCVRLPARAGKYGDYAEELSEYAVLRSRHQNKEPLVAPIHGLVETSMGLGLVVERISGPDGNLAATLDDLIREERVTPKLRNAVDDLATILSDLHVVVGDFTARNLVLRPDGDGFCVIDGLGEWTSVRFRKLSRLAWRLSLEFMRRRIQVRIIEGKSRRKSDRRGASLRKSSEKGL
jgi:hypothetical protein